VKWLIDRITAVMIGLAIASPFIFSAAFAQSQNRPPVTGSLGSRLASVTPNDSTDLPGGPAVAVWVGGAGNVAVIGAGGDTTSVTLNSAAAGSVINIRVRRVLSTGTTATNIVAIR
jgi:hypothetical protein